MTAQHSFIDQIHPSWYPILEPVLVNIIGMHDFVMQEIRDGHTIFPQYDNIFRAFSIPLNSVKVLILGQDPYPTPGHAVGLSFSVSPETHPLPKSLINIFKELEEDLGIPPAQTGDLTPWFEQGVMLLNACLSVRSSEAGSHRNKGWEIITQTAIQGLQQRNNNRETPLPLVAILWGNDAKKAKPMLENSAYIIESAHPSPLSAHRGFFGSHPFSRCNEALINQHSDPIEWDLSAPHISVIAH